MPKSLSTTLVQEKNALGSANPWLLLLDITLPNASKLYLCKNNENITFDGNVYVAANFDIDATEEDAKGAIPQVALKVVDMTQALEPYMQTLGGCIGSTVIIRLVNAGYLEENYSELELSLEVMSSASKAGWVSFTLGIASPFRKRFPLLRARGDFCNWVRWYKGAECAYAGALPTCNGTLEDCRAHNNSRRFGGQPGLGKGGLRVA